MNIYIDIETIPCQILGIKEQIAGDIKPPGNISKPETIAKWNEESRPDAVENAYRKTALDGGFGQIVCASIAINDNPAIVYYSSDWKDSEPFILNSLFTEIKSLDGAFDNHIYIGHYHADFDLRFIYQRAVINGIQPPPNIPFNARQWDRQIFDTMYQWAGHGNSISLDKLCRILGIEGKGDIDGSKVWDYVQAGRMVEVAEYCRQDVERTRKAHKRMTFSI